MSVRPISSNRFLHWLFLAFEVSISKAMVTDRFFVLVCLCVSSILDMKLSILYINAKIFFIQVKKLMIKALERKFPLEKIHMLGTDAEAVNMSKLFIIM